MGTKVKEQIEVLKRGVIEIFNEDELAEKLAEAAKIINKYPMALQLRYLQTMQEMSAENNSTTIFPLPIDLFRPLIKLLEKD